jgi:hypothetical protein
MKGSIMNACRSSALVLSLALCACWLQAEEATTNSGGNYICKTDSLTPLHELLGKYRDKPFEIKAIFPHKNGHLGTYRPGDLLGGGCLYFSIGPAGIDGPGCYAQEKPFSRGMPIFAYVCILDQGKVIDRIPFSKGCCCGGLVPYDVRVPTHAPGGRHEIRVSWPFPDKKVPERIFTFDVENPDFGKPVADPDVEALKQKFPAATVAVLQQGQACEVLGLKSYQGVADTWLTSEAYGQGLSYVLKTGPYAFDHNALLRFDLAAVPKGAKIEAALLKLRSFGGRGGENRALYRLLRAWEAGKGFNGEIRDGLAVESHESGGLQPKPGESSWWYSTRPTKWGAAGAAKSGVDRSEQPLATGRLVPDANPTPAKDEFRTWVAWDVTAAAQDWMQKPESNFGVVVDGKSGGGFCEFLSSEASDLFGRPKLIIIYRLEK